MQYALVRMLYKPRDVVMPRAEGVVACIIPRTRCVISAGEVYLALGVS